MGREGLEAYSYLEVVPKPKCPRDARCNLLRLRRILNGRPSCWSRGAVSISTRVAIRPYSEDDFPLLERTLGDPRMMTYLGGPESAEKLHKRHTKFVALSEDSSAGCIFVITLGPEKVPAGTVGYWERDEDGQKAWETGWSVLPEFQGRGIATAATRRMADLVAGLGTRRYLYAFPSVDNGASNAICRKVGFALLRESSYEYPPNSGNIMNCNVWQLDLATVNQWSINK
jgi:RimJ/RimL family protein N-acetyltransferase